MIQQGIVNELRSFDAERCGGELRRLSAARIKVREGAIDLIEQHTEGLTPEYQPNRMMIARLRAIARGTLVPESIDLIYYAHELREYVRYRRLGYRSLELAGDEDLSYEIWNNAHTASLEEYGVLDIDGKALYHSRCHEYLETQ